MAYTYGTIDDAGRLTLSEEINRAVEMKPYETSEIGIGSEKADKEVFKEIEPGNRCAEKQPDPERVSQSTRFR